MIGTLARSGQGSYTTGNVREYDAWGSVRSGQTTGDPKGRYCGNLGHKADDESGLVYMRARYYEASSGRFTNEDSARNGPNWYAYAGDNPVGFSDYSGKEIVAAAFGFIFGFLIGALTSYETNGTWLAGGILGAIAGFAGGMCNSPAVSGFVSGFLSEILQSVAVQGLKALADPQVWGKALVAGMIGAGLSLVLVGLANALGKMFANYISLFADDDSNDALMAGSTMLGSMAGNGFDYATS